MTLLCKLGLHDWENIATSGVHKCKPMLANRNEHSNAGTAWPPEDGVVYNKCWIFDRICMREGCGEYQLLARQWKAAWAKLECAKYSKSAVVTRSQMAEEKAQLRNIYKVKK